ncbi:hypothetical protein K1719_003488 [Acacia pycnantha]|nr:hypothetical protein K1719_003488 [Acacia pycnantha]
MSSKGFDVSKVWVESVINPYNASDKLSSLYFIYFFILPSLIPLSSSSLLSFSLSIHPETKRQTKMPTIEYQNTVRGRKSICLNQVMAMEGNHDQEEEDLELFQKHVSDQFTYLFSPTTSEDSGADALLYVA